MFPDKLCFPQSIHSMMGLLAQIPDLCFRKKLCPDRLKNRWMVPESRHNLRDNLDHYCKKLAAIRPTEEGYQLHCHPGNLLQYNDTMEQIGKYHNLNLLYYCLGMKHF